MLLLWISYVRVLQCVPTKIMFFPSFSLNCLVLYSVHNQIRAFPVIVLCLEDSSKEEYNATKNSKYEKNVRSSLAKKTYITSSLGRHLQKCAEFDYHTHTPNCFRQETKENAPIFEIGAGRLAMALHLLALASYFSAVDVSICPELPATAYREPPQTATSKRPRFSSIGSSSVHSFVEGS